MIRNIFAISITLFMVTVSVYADDLDRERSKAVQPQVPEDLSTDKEKFSYLYLLSVDAWAPHPITGEDFADDARIAHSSLGVLVDLGKKSIFYSLLSNSLYPEGKLYALCGLYWTDYANFPAVCEQERKKDLLVRILSPTKIRRGNYAEEIDPTIGYMKEMTDDPGELPRLTPSDSLKEWMIKHKASGFISDIRHGGVPHRLSESLEDTRK